MDLILGRYGQWLSRFYEQDLFMFVKITIRIVLIVNNLYAGNKYSLNKTRFF